MPDASLSRHFPRVAAYLGRLPAGVDSYPECQVTAALLHEMLHENPLAGASVDVLPPAVVRIAQGKTPVSAWVSEVQAMALMFALADARRNPEPEFLAWMYGVNSRMLGGRFFRMLVTLATPRLLLAGARHRWSALHRGTSLGLVQERGGRSQVTVQYPARLYDELVLKALGTAFRAALELSNAVEPRVALDSFGDEEAVFVATWT